MKFLLPLLLVVTWMLPASAASITKLLEFKRGKISDLDVAGIGHGFSDLYVVGGF